MDIYQICKLFQSKDESRFLEASEHIVRLAGRNLNIEEIVVLATAIADSGKTIVLPNDLAPFADVPSTGGPASLTTLLCPLLVASFGVGVPKLSAASSIAGAIDTMSIIPGFNPHLSEGLFLEALTYAGIAHSEQTENFCPADRSLIKIRHKQNMMANHSLAAASLLGKKLAIPGTAAAFDFRVGSTGNIGESANVARKAGLLFHQVASELRIPIAVILTDNISFPCSALGRLESLHLMWEMLNDPGPSLSLDKLHLAACIEIAAEACVLVRVNVKRDECRRVLKQSLASGAARLVLKRHLEAQGSGLHQLVKAMDIRTSQARVIVRAPGTGYWSPPSISHVKTWFKKAQAFIGGSPDTSAQRNPHKQLGLRLVLSPGEEVYHNQPAIEILYPPKSVLPADWVTLAGMVTDRPISPTNQILEFVHDPHSNRL